MKNLLIFGLIAVICVTVFSACNKNNNTATDFQQISAARAKEIMDTEKDYIILDVRTPEEYAEGHIRGAILLPDYEIGERAEKMLPDKQQLILVYCRSGRRSKIAARELALSGYSNIMEFGGIIDWPYGTVK